MRVSFAFPGHPVGKGRHRTRVVKTRSGKVFASAYPDAKTVEHEATIGWYAQQAMASHPPIDGPVRLVVIQTFAIPESWPRKKRELALAGSVRPNVKPDWDNLGKIVSDALNGIVYLDDKQVASASIEKWYGPRPECEVVVTTIEQTKHSAPRVEMPSLPFREDGERSNG